MGIVGVALVFVTGYVFSEHYYPLKCKLARSTGWATYFEVLTYGVLWFIPAFLVFAFIDFLDLGSCMLKILCITPEEFNSWPITITQLKIACIFIISILLAISYARITEYCYQQKPERKDQANRAIIERDEFDKIIYEVNEYNDSHEDWRYLLFTLSSGKVYAALCNRYSLEWGEVIFVTITPVLSGYRDKTTKKVEFTTNYFDHFEEYPQYKDEPEEILKDYKIVIPKSEIESVALFNPKVYQLFQDREEKKQDKEVEHGILKKILEALEKLGQ